MVDESGALPDVVSAEDWRQALDELTAKEKAHTRQGDALSAERRKLPMVKVEDDYVFDGIHGKVTLLDLFGDRSQLIVYHFMFAPDWDEGCPGCSWLVDAMSHPAHLNARDTSLVLVSRARLDRLQDYSERMGWDQTWYSSFDSDFNVDMGATVDGEEHHGLSVFLRDGDDIYRTYHAGARGVEHLGSHWTYLDLTPLGRQEDWEDSPPDRPQSEAYTWWRRHDDY